MLSKKGLTHKFCLEMLHQREYKIEEDKDNYITALKPNGLKMSVLFHEGSKFDVKAMKETISTMNEMKVTHALIIYKNDVTPATRTTLLRSLEFEIELFAEKDLQYNITKHRLQPKFERLDTKESSEFTKKYGTMFPTLRLERPISRFYNYKRGDVIRIIRKDGYITYRIVR